VTDAASPSATAPAEPALPDVSAILGSHPSLEPFVAAFRGEVWNSGVDPVLLELCRLRMAQLLGDTEGLAQRSPGVDLGERAEVLAAWPTHPAFSAAERAALDVTEQFVLDVHGMSDERFAALVEHTSPTDAVGLCAALAVFDGLTRLRVALR
jgi:alkylhydroperoxidase family enzyme